MPTLPRRMAAIKTVGIIGTGVIGASWAGLFLSRGLRVLVSDPAPGAKEHLKAYLEGIWPSLHNLGCTEDASLDNCTFVGADMDQHLGEVDFVQENAPEKLELKRSIIANIDARTREDVIIASSSSGLPASEFITKCEKNPGRVLIGHPFNPPHLMPLVEVVPHASTTKTCIDRTLEFYTAMGKHPVLINHETPGFVANRLQVALCNEAYSLVQRGVISAKDCDTCVTSGVGLRWALTGPFMSNILGGGGGKDGFRHLVEHLGPAAQAWTADMDAHRYEFTPENTEKLNASVHEWQDTLDLKALERERDDVLIDVIKQKAKGSNLA